MLGNPFTYGNPISDPRRFVGRAREVEQIFGRLRNEEFESSSLVGDRRIGKTSLLNYLADPRIRAKHGLPPEEYVFVYADLQMVDDTMGPVRLWHWLLKLMRQHCKDNAVADLLAALERDERLDTFALDELFEQVDYKGQYVVFLLDEFEHITANGNFGPDFYYGLRSLVIHHQLALVTSSRRELIELCHSEAIKSSPFFNIFANINLSLFSQADADRLIHLSQGGTMSAADYTSNWGDASSDHFVHGYDVTYDSESNNDSIEVALFQFATPGDTTSFKNAYTLNGLLRTRADPVIPGGRDYDSTNPGQQGTYIHGMIATKGNLAFVITDLTGSAARVSLVEGMARHQYADL
jgi:hypothetical protein